MNTTTIKLLAIITAVATWGTACVQDDHPDVGNSDPETEQFRQALAAEGDIALEYGEDGTAVQGLNGAPSEIAYMTAGAVGGTNAFMYGHLSMLRAVSQLPPTAATPDTRLWEGEGDDGLFLRLFVERSQAPRGTRFEYVLTGRPADDANADMLPILSGDIVRIETRPAELGKQGFGVVRFNFRNYGALKPAEQVDGMVRVAFRRVGKVRQVHVRMIGVETPEDPNFPKAAEYRYTQLPERGGEMRFFGKSDVLEDGAPYESVAVASAWRANRSGIGAAVVFDGSLDVDYWHMGQCWDTALIVGFERLAAPGYTQETGDATSCFDLPELDTPEHQETLPDEDPAIPTAHPEE